MPEWIHERAEHLLAKNPDMKKSTAFAVATQQSHALGKTPKGYGTAKGKQTAKAKYDTPKDDVKAANPGGLKTPKLKESGWLGDAAESVKRVLTTPIPGTPEIFPRAAVETATRAGNVMKKAPLGRPMGGSFVTKRASERMKAAYEKIAGTPPPLPAAARAAAKATPTIAKALPKPKLYGEEGFQALMEGARAAKSNPFAAMKLSMKLAAEKADIETKGSLEQNVETPQKGTEHSQQGAGEQKGVPTEGYHWGQDPFNGKPGIGNRKDAYEVFTDGAEQINVADNHDLLHRIFTNMGPASDAAKATIEQNFSGGRRGHYVTHAQTLLEKVRSVAGRA